MDASVKAWRQQQRAALLERRISVGTEKRKHTTDIVSDRLNQVIAALEPRVIGLYWPIKHEINLIPWARDLSRQFGVTLCLPVVVTPKAPLEYWRWTPGEPMRPGFWDIPMPAERVVLSPNLVLAPLVGFDPAGHRLGYGGGYFDRTLAALQPRPIAIGIGFDFSAMTTIDPQPHDIPMHAILTERRQMMPAEWSHHEP